MMRKNREYLALLIVAVVVLALGYAASADGAQRTTVSRVYSEKGSPCPDNSNPIARTRECVCNAGYVPASADSCVRVEAQAVGTIRASVEATVNRQIAADGSCAVLPILQVVPLSAPVGATINATLVYSATSAPFKITQAQRASWEVATGAGTPMTLTTTDTSGATFTVQSSSPGTATLRVHVCGETRMATVAWVSEDAGGIIRQPSTWLGVAGVVTGVIATIMRGGGSE